MISGVKSILTPEQQEQCKTQCAEKGVKDCPMQSAGKDGAAEKKS